MTFSGAPRHLFQLLPNAKAESADLGLDHLRTTSLTATVRPEHVLKVSQLGRRRKFVKFDEATNP